MPGTAVPQRGQPVGSLIRHWRQHRRWSQLDLACEAEISTRHLSFMETGRARPSREMVLHLAEQLDVPLRERNALLISASYAPTFRERTLDDPELAAARAAMEMILAGHAPNPAMAVDRHWNVVSANAPARMLLAGIDAALLVPPINMLRASLHPAGLAPRIVNYAEWRAHVLHRLQRQVSASGDATLAALQDELDALPGLDRPTDAGSRNRSAPGAAEAFGSVAASVAVPLQLRSPFGTLSFIGTTMVFGTAADITLAELVLETFFPADAATAQALAQLAQAAR